MIRLSQSFSRVYHDLRPGAQAMIRPVRHDSDRLRSIDARFRRLSYAYSPFPRVREPIAVVYRGSARSANEDPHVDRTITVKDGVIPVKNSGHYRKVSATARAISS